MANINRFDFLGSADSLASDLLVLVDLGKSVDSAAASDVVDEGDDEMLTVTSDLGTEGVTVDLP